MHFIVVKRVTKKKGWKTGIKAHRASKSESKKFISLNRKISKRTMLIKKCSKVIKTVASIKSDTWLTRGFFPSPKILKIVLFLGLKYFTVINKIVMYVVMEKIILDMEVRIIAKFPKISENNFCPVATISELCSKLGLADETISPKRHIYYSYENKS